MDLKQVDFLKSEYFKVLPEDVRLEVFKSVAFKEWRPGDVLFREGSEAHFLHVIESGFVKILKPSMDGGLLLLRIFGPGDSVGEMPFASNTPYPATAIAAAKTRTWVIARQDFDHLRRHVPAFAEQSIATLSKNIRVLQERLTEMSLKSIESRLACFLIRISKYGSKGSDGSVWIPFPLSRAELAAAVNIRVETLIRLARRWETEGAIESEKAGIHIRNMAFLKNISDR